MKPATLKAAKQALVKAEERLAKVMEIMDADYLRLLWEIQDEARAALEAHRGDHAKIAELIAPLAEREARTLELIGKQCSPSLMDERLRLETEAQDLKDDIYYEERS